MPKKFNPALKERAVRFPHRSGPAEPTRARSPSPFRSLALTTSQALDTEPSSGACSATNRPGATSEDNVAVRDLKAKVRRLEEEKRDPAFCGDFLRGGARRGQDDAPGPAPRSGRAGRGVDETRVARRRRGRPDQDAARPGGPDTGPGLRARAAYWSDADRRTLLAKFGLVGDHVARPAATLSPGERTRGALALLRARGVNLLVLDEPTNHLDLPAIEQLEQALESLYGTILLVTHDRRMLETVPLTRRWEVNGGRVTEVLPGE